MAVRLLPPPRPRQGSVAGIPLDASGVPGEGQTRQRASTNATGRAKACAAGWAVAEKVEAIGRLTATTAGSSWEERAAVATENAPRRDARPLAKTGEIRSSSANERPPFYIAGQRPSVRLNVAATRATVRRRKSWMP
jgi:hypothetical protein